MTAMTTTASAPRAARLSFSEHTIFLGPTGQPVAFSVRRQSGPDLYFAEPAFSAATFDAICVLLAVGDAVLPLASRVTRVMPDGSPVGYEHGQALDRAIRDAIAADYPGLVLRPEWLRCLAATPKAYGQGVVFAPPPDGGRDVPRALAAGDRAYDLFVAAIGVAPGRRYA